MIHSYEVSINSFLVTVVVLNVHFIQTTPALNSTLPSPAAVPTLPPSAAQPNSTPKSAQNSPQAASPTSSLDPHTKMLLSLPISKLSVTSMLDVSIPAVEVTQMSLRKRWASRS